MEVCQKITDPILIKHSDMTEGHIGLKDICNGDVKKTIQTPSIHFKGLGWTPKHFK
jgi:predicted nucleic acid-binding Zn ribbon protein